jgi:hypothetical protein
VEEIVEKVILWRKMVGYLRCSFAAPPDIHLNFFREVVFSTASWRIFDVL